MTNTLRRDFDTREDLIGYLRNIFPEAAARDGNISPVRGGGKAAADRLQAVDAQSYAATRNYLTGSVTRLSPYLRHGVLTLAQVRQRALNSVYPAKLITELAWRDYWQRLYFQWGSGIWEDREDYKTGHPAHAYAASLPEDMEAGTTALACMDSFRNELHQTGYLHNHARMWLAAYTVHWRRVQWQAGARWFLRHLLDGDPASNNLSWQWVASTFSHKPYFFNRENLEKYTAGIYCKDCPSKNRCPFDAQYEVLESRLFRIAREQA